MPRVGGVSWPDGGPWIVATTSAAANWTLAVATLGAASTLRVAVLRIVAPTEEHAADQELPHFRGLANQVEVRAGGDDPLSVDDVVGIVGSLAGRHGLILVGATAGLLVPLGRDGWTLADLAWALGAPVVVVTDSGAGSANHTTLALDALANRDLPATVVAIGDGDQLGALPVALAGRIPAEAAQRPELVGTEAARWLDPLLHAGPERPRVDPDPDVDVGRGAASDPAQPTTPETKPATPEAEAAAPEAEAEAEAAKAAPAPAVAGGTGGAGQLRPAGTVSGKRVLLALLGVFVVLLLVLCAITVNGLGDDPDSRTEINAERRIGPGLVAPQSAPVRIAPQSAPVRVAPVFPPAVPPPVRRSGDTVCPQYLGRVRPTSPDRRTTARVDAAWRRIERWLAEHAPRSRSTLRPPAPAKQIDDLQVRMSVAFSPDLVASLRRHDGATPGGFELTFLYRPMSLREIVRSWEVSCTILADTPNDDDWWHPSFVPFAETGDGGALLVDQRSGGHGRVGEFYPEEGTRFDGWPPSVADLLEGVARSLESGDPYLGRFRPVVTEDGVLDWEVVIPPTTGPPR